MAEEKRSKKIKSASRRTPVTVLTGFLGAGKTTLMNHLLHSMHGHKFAIIENEFGAVDVDSSIIEANLRESSEELVIEMMNGCICCTVRGDLVTTIKKLFASGKPFDSILIETTGMADPAPVAQTFFTDEEIQQLCELDAIITVVDAKHLLPHLEEAKPDGVENESVEQLAFADKIILNKIDLLENPEQKTRVLAGIRKINPAAEIIEATQAVVDPKLLVNIGGFKLERVLEFDPGFLDLDSEHKHDETVSSVAFHFEGSLNLDLLSQWISELIKNKGTDLYRYKGVLSVAGVPDKFVFQGVHMLFSGEFHSKAKWGKDEKRECRFVFIGKNLDKKEITEGFLQCQMNGPLRFVVGDRVKANAEGGYKRGVILKQWDEGNCYRVRLNNGDEVWAPQDIDEYIKKDDSPPPKKKNNNKKKQTKNK